MIIVAIVASAIYYFSGRYYYVEHIIKKEFIYNYLLPPIVLAEGFNMRKKSIG